MAGLFCRERNAMLRDDLTIVSQREIAPDIYELKLSGLMVGLMGIGQFLHMKVPDASMLLRRPISISQVDKEANVATLIYRVEGQGTAVFAQMQPGQTIDCMGPQGHGFEIDGLKAGQTALLIGGGIGVPPLVELAKQLAAKGVQVQSVIGFATKSAVILEDELAQYGSVTVTTDDGSYGIKGYVSTIVEGLEWPDAVYACGAPGMLRYVDKIFEDHPQAYISIEARMACGMGACYACVVPVKNGRADEYVRVCEEGPVFATGQLVLD
ncbi:dihydroorotate dehydrogenase electron transfer subunit [Streptococcus caprae]|uniref:Dihydroorotate dehydrogenase B (NAD(+)), electron transfer subunit n=1 Tax=Streptococcus caprae TaxID=1640501 RepID=A0ABV8CTD1_9STRE